jgi:hypothetical protein
MLDGIPDAISPAGLYGAAVLVVGGAAIQRQGRGPLPRTAHEPANPHPESLIIRVQLHGFLYARHIGEFLSPKAGTEERHNIGRRRRIQPQLSTTPAGVGVRSVEK